MQIDDHDNEVLRMIYGRGLEASVKPSCAPTSCKVLLRAGLIEKGCDPHPEAGSVSYKVTVAGRAFLAGSIH
jgi:hypothetical protein